MPAHDSTSPPQREQLLSGVLGRARVGTAGALGRGASVLLHAVGLGLLLLGPLFVPAPPPAPARGDILATLIYDPPPPPPAPLPSGSPGHRRPARPEPTRLSSQPQATALTVPVQTPAPLEPPQPDSGIRPEDQLGSETGSVMGHELGMEEGVDGGVVGGVPGGVPGGVLGASGNGPVLDYDSPPRLVRQTKPSYPHEAFVKKVQGEVELEILIDSFGRVVGTRVLRSIPLLDAAAVQCVREWTFRPALRQGVAVATIARAPVGFRLY